MSKGAADRWARAPWFCDICHTVSSQGHKTRHIKGRMHQRMLALSVNNISVHYEVKQSDKDFAHYMALVHPRMLSGYELDLLLRIKFPDKFEEAA